ncbi:MAG: hypothetical protein KA223_08790 [Candidatus Accumulibacter sp.]|nr:hypothetical protein [Accumulibacter sp.]
MEPGSLELTVTWQGQPIVAEKIVSTWPDVAHARRVLLLAVMGAIVPRLFSLCPPAQGTAARRCFVREREMTGQRATTCDAVRLAKAAIACSLNLNPCVLSTFRVVDA